MNKNYEYQTRSINDLIPYVNNSRTHSEDQITQIASSIKEFGFTNPILIDSEDGIIAGHGRVLAAQKLSIDEVPCIILEGLTKAQKKAYIIADNQLALNAGWNYELLKVEIEGLKDLDFNLDLLGFDQDGLENILNGWSSDLEIPEDEDENPFFNLRVKGNELDEDDVREIIKRALKESGIEGLEIA